MLVSISLSEMVDLSMVLSCADEMHLAALGNEVRPQGEKICLNLRFELQPFDFHMGEAFGDLITSS